MTRNDSFFTLVLVAAAPVVPGARRAGAATLWVNGARGGDLQQQIEHGDG